MKYNYHTHTKLCNHAVGMSEDYVLEALKQGYLGIGMSDHGPIKPEFMDEKDFKFNWLDRQMNYEDFIKYYLPDCRKTKEKYKHLIDIYIGAEIEYIEEYHDYFVKMREELDYMNLAGHYFYHNGKVVNAYESANFENIYSYALHLKKAMETKLYNILVHPDLFMYQYKSFDGSNTFDSECVRCARLLIESAIENNIFIEINVGGIDKALQIGEVGKCCYPRDEFWEIVKEYPEVKVVIGIDAHDPLELSSYKIDLAYEFAKKHGIKLEEKVESIG